VPENDKGQEPVTWFLTYFCVLGAFTAAATWYVCDLALTLVAIFLGA